MTIEAAIAVSRFGFGAQPGEIAKIGADAKGFLKSQLRRTSWLATPSAASAPARAVALARGEIALTKASPLSMSTPAPE